jgi:hypothetical protein
MDFLFDSKWNAHILIDQKKKYVDGMYNNEMIKTREREREKGIITLQYMIDLNESD